MDIAELSDAELRSKLKEYGVNAGPIGATTRLFYEKKLGKLIDSGGVPAKEDTEEEEEDEEEDEEEVMEEEVQINYRTAPRTYAAPPAHTPVQRKPEPKNTPQDYTPITKARKATVDTPQPGSRPTSGSARPASKPAKASSGGSGIATWIKLLFIVIVALLVYLVIINMNQSAQDKIPISHEEV